MGVDHEPPEERWALGWLVCDIDGAGGQTMD